MLIRLLNRQGLARYLPGLSILLALAPNVWAQGEPNDCSVAQFRALALDTHDARLREERANRWLDSNLRACNLAQLRALGSNRGAWLGVADTATLAGRIDGAIERRIRENPDEVKALFSPAPAKEAPPQRTASGETPAAPRTRIVGPGTPAVAQGGAAVPVPVPVPAAAPVAPPANSPTPPGAPAPASSAAGAAPTGSPVAGPASPAPPQAPAPAPQAPPPEPPARFTDAHRNAVRSHYERSVVAGACAPTLQPRDGLCESINPIRLWRVGDPLPVTAAFQDIPSSLASGLGAFRSGLSTIRLGNDILLIDGNRRVVAAITDLGSPRAAGGPSGASPR
jgi:hypothetical protein